MSLTKKELKNRVKDAYTFEDDLVLELEEFYKKFVEGLQIKEKDKKKILDLVNVLYEDSKRHRSTLKNLEKQLESSNKNEF